MKNSFDHFSHGGKIQLAAARYDIPVSEWLDLSTGINPHGWRVPPIPASVWQRLPEEEDGLLAAAAAYYGTAPENILATAGSQAAIQVIPSQLPPGKVLIPNPTFSEHHHAWRAQGHSIDTCSPTATAIDTALVQKPYTCVVVVNPNNPTGNAYSRQKIEQWRQKVVSRGGLLLVDEAFMDATSAETCVTAKAKPGLIILRSIGKFFGLAGLRLGFVIAPNDMITQLHRQLGPWSVSHPARFVGEQVLRDTGWHTQMQEKLDQHSQRLRLILQVLSGNLEKDVLLGGCRLFQSLRSANHAEPLFDFLATQGILTRYFPQTRWLRFGLPTGDADWLRLENALARYQP